MMRSDPHFGATTVYVTHDQLEILGTERRRCLGGLPVVTLSDPEAMSATEPMSAPARTR